ncbi:glycosyhydrolase [Streptococcus cuniculi]|uniref:Glycosyhydrolase n=2 Tax=Streptococcus cuniculi TaxID=1432788 RepID=A0A4Y9JG92_9STRE|nr:C39 family peptidase [Streptococcus cuniculi]TFU99029.1 glycosyhydrolase [Streptococcus cuniculi]
MINGELVVLEPAQKAGKYEADNTQAPRELGGPSRQESAGDVADKPTNPVYRLYNTRSMEHLYTQDAHEKDQLPKLSKDWVYEGIAWQAAQLSEKPVYRVYNPKSGEHLYTQDTYEIKVLTSKHGWKAEGIAYYSSGSKPVYRLYNPKAGVGSHFVTLDTNEKDILVSQHGWKYEGIAWYAEGGATPSTDNYRLLGVKNYKQYAFGAPSGCEGASLLQALQYKGKLTDWGLVQFLKTIPKSPNGNPNSGFVGSPFEEHRYVYSAIYPAPLTTWAKQYHPNVQDISGSSVDSLLDEVKAGNPVVTWVTINFQPVRRGSWPFGPAVNNNHAVTLDGFNQLTNQVHVSDPIGGSYWLSRSTFEKIYTARKYAVVVR